MNPEDPTRTIQKLHHRIDSLKRELKQSQCELETYKISIQALESSKYWRLRQGWTRTKQLPLIIAQQTVRLLKTIKRFGVVSPINVLREQATNKKEYRSDVRYQYYNKHQFTLSKAKNCAANLAQMNYQPLFSLILPVCDIESPLLDRTIESITRQCYPNWELCIVNVKLSGSHVRAILEGYANLDSRIRVEFVDDASQAVSAAIDRSMGSVSGDYVALLHAKDELAPHALYENAKVIAQHPNADFIYSDEDKIDTQNRCWNPFFKPDWSPDYLHAYMYTRYLSVYSTRILRIVDGLRRCHEQAYEYDLALRVAEETEQIFHISKVLYHCRTASSAKDLSTELHSRTSMLPAKITSEADQAARTVLEEMVERSDYSGWVDEGFSPGLFRIRRDISGHPLVSIVIPSAGTSLNIQGRQVCLLEQCIFSIRRLSTYQNIEIVVVDGYDIPEAVLNGLRGNESEERFRVIRCDSPFNFSQRMNIGIRAAKGDFLLMLNDDVEVITPTWIEALLEFAQQQEVGAVGAKLYYPSGLLQHAGVVILSGGPTHAFHKAEGNHKGYYLSNFVNRNALGVTGACLMLRREVFEEVNKFDEIFPLNFNDVDLCLRIHRAGYRNVFTPYAELIHYESVSRGVKVEPIELIRLHQKFEETDYMRRDPYYNDNLSMLRPFFEIASPYERRPVHV